MFCGISKGLVNDEKCLEMIRFLLSTSGTNSTFSLKYSLGLAGRRHSTEYKQIDDHDVGDDDTDHDQVNIQIQGES